MARTKKTKAVAVPAPSPPEPVQSPTGERQVLTVDLEDGTFLRGFWTPGEGIFPNRIRVEGPQNPEERPKVWKDEWHDRPEDAVANLLSLAARMAKDQGEPIVSVSIVRQKAKEKELVFGTVVEEGWDPR